MVRVGIVGVGNTIGIAGNHIDGYLRVPEAKITAVYDIIRERAAGYIEKFGLEGQRPAKAMKNFWIWWMQSASVPPCHPH